MATQEEIARGAKRGSRKTRKGRLSAAFDVDKQEQSVVCWGEVEPSGIVALTSAVSALGGAVTFGGSRDQGALQVTIFLDGEKVVRWCDSPKSANATLAELWETLQEVT